MMHEEKLLARLQDLSPKANIGVFEKMAKAVKMAHEYFHLNQGGIQSFEVIKCIDEAVDALEKM